MQRTPGALPATPAWPKKGIAKLMTGQRSALNDTLRPKIYPAAVTSRTSRALRKQKTDAHIGLRQQLTDFQHIIPLQALDLRPVRLEPSIELAKNGNQLLRVHTMLLIYTTS
jgi:hypothetical protein